MTSQEKGERAALCGRISDVSEERAEHGTEEGKKDGWKGMMARNRSRILQLLLQFICTYCQLLTFNRWLGAKELGKRMKHFESKQ